MLAGMYCITPFLRQIIAANNETTLVTIVFVFLSVSSIETLLGAHGATALTSFLPFIGYYLAGYVFYRTTPSISQTLLSGVFFLCGAIIAGATGYLLPKIGQMAWGYTYSYTQPVVIIMSLAVFVFGVRLSDQVTDTKLLSVIAPLMLGVYVLHPFWLWALSLPTDSSHIFSSVALAFMLSLLTAWFLSLVPGVKRLVI
jgi:surface polysaccharide O-acyltransferase-like enzyme